MNATLTLDEYICLARAVPPPTRDQIDAYVAYLAACRLWYSALPLTPPGIDGHFFIDPYAGMDMAPLTGGRVGPGPRRLPTVEAPKPHYAWVSTTNYRQRFGHLSFSLRFVGRVWVPRIGRMAVPIEAVQAGHVALTAPFFPAVGVVATQWEPKLEAHARHGCWPAESGGREAMVRLLTLLWARDGCQDDPDRQARDERRFSEEFVHILSREKQRLWRAARRAIGSVCRLIHGPRPEFDCDGVWPYLDAPNCLQQALAGIRGLHWFRPGPSN